MNAEPMLFINYGQANVFEYQVFLEDCMCPYYDIRFSWSKAFETFFSNGSV